MLFFSLNEISIFRKIIQFVIIFTYSQLTIFNEISDHYKCFAINTVTVVSLFDKKV